MSEWQPIETAPKDGTVILQWHPCGNLWPAYYLIVQWSPSCEAWMSPIDTDSSYFFPGTHWMPLPAPPHKTGEVP